MKTPPHSSGRTDDRPAKCVRTDVAPATRQRRSLTFSALSVILAALLCCACGAAPTQTTDAPETEPAPHPDFDPDLPLGFAPELYAPIVFAQSQDRLHRTVWLPDGERIAVVVDEHIEIWRAPSQPLSLDTPLDAAPPQPWLPERLATTRDLGPAGICAERLVIASDGEVVVCVGSAVVTGFSTETGAELWAWDRRGAEIDALGGRLVALRRDGEALEVLDATTGAMIEVHPLPDDASSVSGCDDRVAVVLSDRVIVSAVSDGVFEDAVELPSEGVRFAVWHPDCDRLALGWGEWLELWDVSPDARADTPYALPKFRADTPDEVGTTRTGVFTARGEIRWRDGTRTTALWWPVRWSRDGTMAFMTLRNRGLGWVGARDASTTDAAVAMNLPFDIGGVDPDAFIDGHGRHRTTASPATGDRLRNWQLAKSVCSAGEIVHWDATLLWCVDGTTHTVVRLPDGEVLRAFETDPAMRGPGTDHHVAPDHGWVALERLHERVHVVALDAKTEHWLDPVLDFQLTGRPDSAISVRAHVVEGIRLGPARIHIESDMETEARATIWRRTRAGDWILRWDGAELIACPAPSLDQCRRVQLELAYGSRARMLDGNRIAVLQRSGIEVYDFEAADNPVVRHPSNVSAFLGPATSHGRPDGIELAVLGARPSLFVLGRDGRVRVTKLALEGDIETFRRRPMLSPVFEPLVIASQTGEPLMFFDRATGARLQPGFETQRWWTPTGMSTSGHLVAYRHLEEPRLRLWSTAERRRVAEVEVPPALAEGTLLVSDDARWLVGETPSSSTSPPAAVVHDTARATRTTIPAADVVALTRTGLLVSERAAYDLGRGGAKDVEYPVRVDASDRCASTSTSVSAGLVLRDAEIALHVSAAAWNWASPSLDGHLFTVSLAGGVAVYDTATGGLVAELAVTADGRFNVWTSRTWWDRMQDPAYQKGLAAQAACR